jgi:Arc/MetJ-type ribon-helix-helix transcriptional regulator
VKAKKEVAVWNLQVPKMLDEEVEEAVKADRHMTKAELIRAAVRYYLDAIKKEARK